MATPKKTAEAEADALLGEEKTPDTAQQLAQALAVIEELKKAPRGDSKREAYKRTCEAKEAAIYTVSYHRKGHSTIDGKILDPWKTQSMQPREYEAFCKSAGRLGIEYKVLTTPKK